MSTVAIFGGSGRLGSAIVRCVARQCRTRFAYHSKADEAARIVAELRAQGRDVEASRVDVRNPQEVDDFLRVTAEGDGELTGVISANGAGFPPGPFYEVEEAEFRRIVEVDVFGTFHVMKSATRLLGMRGGGSIVVLLTAAVLRSAIFDGMSAVPKAAVAGMIRQLARDAGPLNVRCNGIAPGVVDTDKVADIEALPAYAQRLVKAFVTDTPVGRFNSPETIAALAAFLVSDVAADISGQIIGADGGYSA
jgi:3-oxoacyl-[acyl-carrier protein] reductase